MAKAEALAPTGVSRREFLYYIWGASLALFAVEAGGLLVWFMLPRFREGEFGGTFTIPVEEMPGENEPPIGYSDGRFWLVNLNTNNAEGDARMRLEKDDPNDGIQGIAAIYKVCTHLGCIYGWNDANDRFECPCHGSKYRLDGRRIESPAPRTLDRFQVQALDADGNELEVSPTSEDGYFRELLLPPNTASIRVDTGTRLKGITQELLCSVRESC